MNAAWRCVGGVLASLVLLSGCQVGQGPVEESPSPEPSPSESAPTPSRKLPVLAEKATKKSRNGASAFAEYYYALINYGRATGDWKPAQELTLPSCQTCADFWAEKPSRMDNERRIYIQPGTETGRFEDPRTGVTLLLTTASDPENVLDDSGERWLDILWLDYRGGRWLVEDLEVEGR